MQPLDKIAPRASEKATLSNQKISINARKDNIAMKKIILIIAISCLSTSCAISKLSHYHLDYSRYSEIGFMVSPLTDPQEPYTPIATVGAIYEYNDYAEVKTYSDLLDVVVKDAIKKGANALLGLKSQAQGDGRGWHSIEIEGVAVKLENRPLVNLTSLPDKKEYKALGYDYTAAKTSSKFYIKKKKGERYYLDPETDTHITKEEFLKKYTEKDLQTIERLHKSGN